MEKSGLGTPLNFYKPDMSDEAKDFLRNIVWSFKGGVVSAGVLLLTTILAGRFLGPTEYGKFNFATAIAQILLVVLVMGMDRASLRFIAQSETHTAKAHNVSAALYFILFIALIFGVIFTGFNGWIAKTFAIEPLLLWSAFLFALFLSFRQMFESFLRGLHAFQFQMKIRIFESLLILSLFLLLTYFFFPATYLLYVLSLVGGYALFILLSAHHLKSHFSSFDAEMFKRQFSFAKIYFVAALLGVLFGSLDKIVIGKYLSFHDLGIYGAYTAASLNFTAQISTIVGNVFSPMLSKNLHQTHVILRRMERFIVVGFIPIFILVMSVTAAIMFLLGSEYPLKIIYVVGFSLVAVLNMIFSTYALSVALYSKRAIVTTTLIGNGINFLFVGIFIGLVYWLELSLGLVIVALAVYQLANIAMCKSTLHACGAYRHPKA